MNDSQKESTFSPTKMTLDITKEISQVNKNLGFIAQALNQGIISGELSLKDNENANVFCMFTRNLCAFNDQLLEITVHQPGKVCNKPIDSVEFDRNKYSLSDSVNNSEITNDTGEAQEQSSCLWVSEVADDGQEDTVPGESNDNDPVINKTHKKRKSSAKGHGLTVRKKKGKKSGSTNPKQATQISTTNVGNCNMSNSGLSDNGHQLNSLQRKERCVQVTWKEISSIDMVEEYIYRYSSTTNNRDNNCDIDFAAYLERSIDECGDKDEYPYHAQCLVILIPKKPMTTTTGSISSSSSSSTVGRNKMTVSQYFNNGYIDKILVVERPQEHCQLYVVEKLAQHYHFSFPTVNIVPLYKMMKKEHNSDLQILFIPRTCNHYESENLLVVNGISPTLLSLQDSDFQDLSQSISSMNSGVGANTRSSNSTSIGLQTMYSHQQHQFRYCMLPHSKPHVPTVKQHSAVLRKSILDGYMFACDIILKSVGTRLCPFDTECDNQTMPSGKKKARLSLRTSLYEHLIGEDLDHQHFNIGINKMFESCSVQTMGKLSFHCDSLNCPSMEETVALHVPFQDAEINQKCMSFLFYGRKCVNDYSSRIEVIDKFIHNERSCPLTKLCLSALLETNGTLDYQGQLFENDNSLDNIGAIFEMNPSTACSQVTEFTGLNCFKMGAAFDKMGYYSIFLNVFLSLFYMGIIKTIDDSISLCIYFGLICNGTSNLAATWKNVCDNVDFCKQWLAKKDASTKLFNILVFLERQRRQT